MIIEQLNRIELTNTEKNIKDYLIEHQNEITDLTITKLAANTYSSNASIIRLVRKLGYKGYKEFIVAYIKEIESNKHIRSNVNYDFPFVDGRPNEVLKGLVDLYQESTELIFKSVDLAKIEKAVDLILKANKIFIYSIGDTKVTAEAFMNRLIKLNIYPILVNEEAHYITPNIGKEDCVLFVSYTLTSQDFDTLYHTIHDHGGKIIVISANARHMAAKQSECFIEIPNKEGQIKVSTFYSQFMFEFIFNLIYSRLYVCTKGSKK